MLIIIVRVAILYTLIIIILRVMGKKQIGQMQPSELVVAIIIADLAAVPMQDNDIPLINGIIPIIVLMVAEVVISYAALKNLGFRTLLSGRPSILISGGIISWKELENSRMNINDLTEQLRVKGYPNLSDIEFAILETGGKLSVIPKSQKRPVNPEDLGIKTEYEGLPTALIIDGKINLPNLRSINLTEKWLKDQLAAHGIYDVQSVIYACIDTKGQLFYQQREEKGY